jgi:hypothetical protein
MLLHIVAACIAASFAQAEPIFHLDSVRTRVLPDPFSRNWITTLITPSSFFATIVGGNNTVQEQVTSGLNSTFISLSDEFDELFDASCSELQTILS